MPRPLSAGICLLVVLLGAGANAQFPDQAPPHVASDRFLPWALDAVERAVQSVPRERAQTVHFSQSGDDTTGDGSLNNPFRSIGKANAVLAASAGNVRLRFRRGDTWREAAGLVVERPSVTVDSYSASTDPPGLERPRLTRFEPPLSPSEWSPDGAFQGTFTANVAGEVAWVKWVGDDSTVFRRQPSVGACRASPGSWHWSGGTLTVRNHDATPLNSGSRRIELVLKNQLEGVWIKSVADVRVEGLRIDGYGAGTPGDFSYRGYAVHSDALGSQRHVVLDCEAFYNGRHSVTKVGDGFGGSLVVVRCRMGWLVNDDANVVSYSSLGGQELISAYNEFVGGTLPDGDLPYAYGGSGMTNYMHSSNDAVYKHAHMLCLGNRIVPGPFQNSEVSLTPSAPAFSRFEDCRSFVVWKYAPARTPNASDRTKPSRFGGDGLLYKSLGSANVAYVGCVVRPSMLWGRADPDAALLTEAAGHWINSVLTFDFSGCPVGAGDRVLSLSPVDPGGLFRYTANFTACHLRFVVPGGATVGFSGPMLHPFGSLRNSVAGRWRGTMVGCIVDGTDVGNGAFRLGFGNDQAYLWGNAYAGATDFSGAWCHDQDPAGRAPVSGPPPRHAGQEWWLPSDILIEGKRLAYDLDGRIRPARPTVGPVERWSLPPVAKPGDGLIIPDGQAP
jgi:hypothetical protein